MTDTVKTNSVVSHANGGKKSSLMAPESSDVCQSTHNKRPWWWWCLVHTRGGDIIVIVVCWLCRRRRHHWLWTAAATTFYSRRLPVQGRSARLGHGTVIATKFKRNLPVNQQVRHHQVASQQTRCTKTVPGERVVRHDPLLRSRVLWRPTTLTSGWMVCQRNMAVQTRPTVIWTLNYL